MPSPAARRRRTRAITRAILAGEAGPARDLAVLNAGAAIYAGGRADSIADGVRVAQEAIDSGAAAGDPRAATWSSPIHRMNVLERIVDATRDDRARRARGRVPLRDLERGLRARGPTARSPRRSRPGVSVIAEHKRRSPSAGEIRAGSTVTDIVSAYERGGASALSVLTEPEFFGGSLDDLDEARAAARLPILRKDFIVDPYQVYEVRGHRSRRVLLIVAALNQGRPRSAARRGAGARPRRAGRGPRGARSWTARSRCSTPTSSASTTATSATSRSTSTGPSSCSPTSPAGKTVVSESGFHSREQLDEPGARRRRRGARRRVAHARRRVLPEAAGRCG